jgi:hypothetical protein
MRAKLLPVRRWLVLVVVVLALARPALAGPVLEPTPSVHAVKRPRWGLFGGGLALFLAGWAADVGAAYGVPGGVSSHAWIPLVGPLIQMGDKWGIDPKTMHTGNVQVDAQIDSRAAQVNSSIQDAAYAVLAIDFGLQLAGAVMAIVGVSTKTWAIETGPSGRGAFTVRF